jgi:DNA-binding NarL/FixJ family response regulator
MTSDAITTDTIRVLLADDAALIRSGLQMLLSARSHIEVVGEAGDGARAIDLARRLRPDVVVMDLQMPHVDGVAATREITSDDFTDDPNRTVKVIILTGMGSTPEEVCAILRAGASGYLLKDAVPAELVTAVESVASGLAYLTPASRQG